MPHFSQAGWDCYAVSLRGQGGSERPEGMKSGGSLASHADDLHSVVGSLPRAPVIIAHSFGGLLAQRCGVVGRILGKTGAGQPTPQHGASDSEGRQPWAETGEGFTKAWLVAGHWICMQSSVCVVRRYLLRGAPSGQANLAGLVLVAAAPPTGDLVSCWDWNGTYRRMIEHVGLWILAGHSNRADPWGV